MYNKRFELPIDKQLAEVKETSAANASHLQAEVNTATGALI